ncbi:DUF5652 family protein [Candidatus Parcubacteria bacterium]|nr:DUF5652 family protein [Candidatus Parcubacteria bacterium]
MIDWINTHPLLGLLIIAWSVIWKGLALWEAAKRREKYWFVAILLLNTFGVLEIIYLLFIAKAAWLRRR